MRITYNGVGNYKLDHELTILSILEEFGMKMANAVRAPIGEKWNELPITNAKLL